MRPHSASQGAPNAGRFAGGLVAAVLLAACEAASPNHQGPPAVPAAGRATVAASGAPTVAAVAVEEIIDGDTVRLRIGGAAESVRLIGINTPERGECLSAEATERLTELLDGRAITLEQDTSDRDRYGRLLRYVYADGELVNEALVESGLAIARRYEPDTALADRLDTAQARAQAAGAGQWAASACGPATIAQVEITDLVWDAPGDDGQNPNGEWVVIRNAGSGALDLAGWTVKDTSASHRYDFPDGFSLAAGGSVRLSTGCGTDSADALHWCRQGSAVWNNDGDTAFVLDPSGNVVTTHTYGGGSVESSAG